MKKKYGGLMPKKPPLISKVFVRSCDHGDEPLYPSVCFHFSRLVVWRSL